MIDDLARGVRVEEDQELGGARAEALHLLHGPAVEERREPPVPFLLVPGGLHRDEQAGPPREGEPIDRRPDAELRVEEVAARVGSQGARNPELDGLHLRIGRSLRVLRMEHLLEAPPLVHRDHREATGVVRNLLEAAELADRNPHPFHLRWSQRVRDHIDLLHDASAEWRHRPQPPWDTRKANRTPGPEELYV